MVVNPFRDALRTLQQARGLRVDLCSDENGKAIHEDCYVQRVTGQHGNPPLAMAN